MAIQFLRGNASTLQSSQQVFLPGQPIFEQDTGKLKIGNGSDVYSALKYVGESGGSSSFVPTLVSNDGHSQHYIDLAKNLRIAFGYIEIGGGVDPGRKEYSWTLTPNFQGTSSKSMHVRDGGVSGFLLEYNVFGFTDLPDGSYELLEIQAGLATFNKYDLPAVSLTPLNYNVTKTGIQYSLWGDTDALASNDLINYIVLAELLDV